MATVSSLSAPGVEVREYDNSLRIASNTGTTVFVPGFAAQGPVEEVISISSIMDFENIYGIPTNAAERYFYYTCLAILNNSGEGTTLLTSRLPYGANAGDNVANAYTLLAYPAIPIAKNKDNTKGYDYYEASEDSTDESEDNIKNLFKIKISSPSTDTNESDEPSTGEDEPAELSTGEGGSDEPSTDKNYIPTKVSQEIVLADPIGISDVGVLITGNIPDINHDGASDLEVTITGIKDVESLSITPHVYSEIDTNNKRIIVNVAMHIADTANEKYYGYGMLKAYYESTTELETAFQNSSKYTVSFVGNSDAISFTRKAAFSNVDYTNNTVNKLDGTEEDVTYIIGAPATYNVSLDEYYSIIAGEYFQWKDSTFDSYDKQSNFGKSLKEYLGKCAFIAINTSRATINDSYEGYYIGMTDNLFNESSEDYKLNSINSVKFTSWNRKNNADDNGIVDTRDKSGVNEFIKIDPKRLDFYLDSSNKGSISNILQVTTTAFDTSAEEYDDTINLGLFKLSKSTVGTESMKLTYSIVEKYNAAMGKTRSYSVSNAVSPQNYFIESIVESSKNLTVMVNPYIASKIKIDINGKLRGKVRFASTKLIDNYNAYQQKYLVSPVSVSDPNALEAFQLSAINIKNWGNLVSRIGAPLHLLNAIKDNTKSNYDNFNLTDALYPFATYTVVKKNNKFIGSVPQKISRALELVSNDEEYPDLDIVVEGGLSTIYAYSNNADNVIAQGSSSLIYAEDELNGTVASGEQNGNTHVFNEDAILQGIEDLRTTRTAITDVAQKVVEDYMAVQEAFLGLASSFQNGGRGDTFYIPDILRGILVRGKDTKVERLYGSKLMNNVYGDNSENGGVSHSWSTSIYSPIKHIIESFTTSYASVYAQWFKITDGHTNEKFWVPASGYMAALLCATDQLQGPWYAGAGLNRGLVRGVLDCAVNPNQKQRGDLYKICVNSVPKMANIGITSWGIRTLSKKASAFDQNTCRRTFLFIEKAVKKLLRYYLFEPNNSYTQLSIYNEIEPYMESIRNQGGVYSYTVVCDSSNNTEEIVNAGNLAVDISAAPTRTAEFIVLNMTANKYSSEVATSEFNS